MRPVLFFGRISGIAAHGPTATEPVAAFRARMEAAHPELAGEGILLAVNQELVEGDEGTVGPEDEIAFMSPMSGG